MKNKQNIRIAVAMSGGVDSSVAAALLVKEYGKENVFGVTMRLFCYGEKAAGPKNCCSLEAINDAKAVCKKIGIKHYVLDFEKEFEKEVINNFVSQYLAGKTPNPCVRCNSIIKFDYLLEKSLGLGADYLATGHYASIVGKNKKQKTKNKNYSSSEVEKFSIESNNKFRLLKGLDEKKDQSYFLYGLNQEQMAHILFPLGDHKKEEVRKLAKKFELKTAEKTESQEICFIETNYHEYLSSIIVVQEGEIIDKEGENLGKHKGLPFYTIGQRRGIGIARKEPYYVIDFDIKKNQLIVGDEEDLYKKEFKVMDLNWISGEKPKKEFSAEVSIRYNMKSAKAKIFLDHKLAIVVFDKPQKAITPGQSAVFYSKDEVLGGGIIA